MAADPISAEEFERRYAVSSGRSVVELRKFRTVRPCACGSSDCRGWQSISHDRAKEYDQNKAEGILPEHLW